MRKPWIYSSRKLLMRIVLALTVLFLVSVAFVVFCIKTVSLSVHLLGEEAITLEYGEGYQESGAEVFLRGTYFCKNGKILPSKYLHVTDDVNESLLGRYTVHYHASFLWWNADAQRQVNIVDTRSPVITLKKDTKKALLPGNVYQEAGFLAVDNYDGDITDRVIRTEEMGKITYAVTDSSGNPAVEVREVPYHDPIPPEITLEGGQQYLLPLGVPYVEPGYTANDNVDGDLTDMVTVAGHADCLSPGVYPITYTVTDGYENTTVVVRNVEVRKAERPDTVYPEGKAIYLTFDDGPGPYTSKLLDILDKYGVKATFFVMDTEEYGLMREIVRRGHSIGIHTITHNYQQIYSSPEAFFADLYGMQKIIYEQTGVLTTLMRFPGGSSNEVSIRICKGIMTQLTELVQDAGFQYFDWNVLSGDAGDTTKTQEVYNYVVNAARELDVALVLQHDIHGYSVAAVEDIILWGLENGYQFLPLRENSPGFHQDVAN